MQNKINKDNYQRNVRLGITHGDFNGISYEVIIKSLADNRILDFFTPVIYGLSRVMLYNRKNLDLNGFNFNTVKASSSVRNGKVNLVNINDEDIRIEFGKSDPNAGKYAHLALDKAVKDLKENRIDAIVTAPINKENIQSEDFTFPGHTEYFAKQFETKNYLMLMVSNALRIGTVTGHVPLKEVPGLLTEELITSKINVLEKSLKVDFGINKPKIAILGLNPHAGENGNIGTEEIDVITPALISAKKRGILAFGPFPADGFFATEYTKYDAILAMYHDQGLIPFKTLAFNDGVNYTAGLPYVRTSPAHGTAYDMAGKNTASCESMRSALYLAVDIQKNRESHKKMNSNPLGSNLIKDVKNTDSRKTHKSTDDGA
jgi:4-hydroxythreonine-4-phosphate dehydrogenase